MEMALRTYIVRKMISGRIEFTPEFKEMLPGGADSLSFLEVWGMPEGTIFNIYTEYLKMIEQGVSVYEIIKLLENADNQFENASNTSVQPENIEEYIKLRIKRDHGDCLISDEFIDSWIYFIPIWIDDEKRNINIVQPQIDLLKKIISKDLNYMGDGLSDIIECIKDCKPPLRVIKTALGETHDSYLSLSNEFVSHFQSKMITIVNIKLREYKKKKRQFLYEEVSDSFWFGSQVVEKALDVMYWLEGFHIGEPLKVQFEKNIEEINILAKEYCIVSIWAATGGRSLSTNLGSTETPLGAMMDLRFNMILFDRFPVSREQFA